MKATRLAESPARPEDGDPGERARARPTAEGPGWPVAAMAGAADGGSGAAMAAAVAGTTLAGSTTLTTEALTTAANDGSSS